jgi:signal transduction histidine kinase
MNTPNQDTTLLIVSGNPTTLELLSLMLHDRLPVETHGFNTSESAFSNVQTISPTLVLLDIVIPGQDGLSICEQFRTHPLTQDLPIIILSASTDSSYRAQALKLGASDYIIKPFALDEIVMKINHQINARKAQLALTQNEKMNSLGKLIAGIAHDINDPMCFVVSNIEPAQQYLRELLMLIDLYENLIPYDIPQIQAYKRSIDLDYVKQDFINLLDSMETGSNQIMDIVQSVNFFSRTDETTHQSVALHQVIDTALLLLKNQLKETPHRQAIAIFKHYGDLPAVMGSPGQLSQVFMNLLSNAIDAIDEKAEMIASRNDAQETYFLPRIEVSTGLSSDDTKVIIKVSDNGIGINNADQAEIFEQFFTTKPDGKGTGLGLSIVSQIIKAHHGTIRFQSEAESWSEFTIALPIRH